MAKRGRFYVNQSISFPPALLAAARKRSANLGLSFSAYVQKCLERDLQERGPIVFREVEGVPQMAAEAPQSGSDAPKPKRARR